MAGYCGAIVVHLPGNEGELHDILPLLKLLHYAPQIKCSFSCSMKDFQRGSQKNVDSMLLGDENSLCTTLMAEGTCSTDRVMFRGVHWTHKRNYPRIEVWFTPGRAPEWMTSDVVLKKRDFHRQLVTNVFTQASFDRLQQAKTWMRDATYLEEQAMWDVFMGVTGT
jgi:hypothetical protein